MSDASDNYGDTAEGVAAAVVQGSAPARSVSAGDVLPTGRDDPQFDAKMARLREVLGRQRSQAGQQELVASVAQTVIAALDEREALRDADRRRDELAQPLLQAGYSPDNPEHVAALNLGVQLRAGGYSEEAVAQFVQTQHPLGNSEAAPEVAAVEAEATPAPVAEAEVIPPSNAGTANLPPVPRAAQAGSLDTASAGQVTPPSAEQRVTGNLFKTEQGMVDNRGVKVPAINDPAFASYVEQGLAASVSAGAEVGG